MVLEREFFIHNLLVRIHFIVVMMRWTGLAPLEFEFSFPGSLTSTSLDPTRMFTYDLSESAESENLEISLTNLTAQGFCVVELRERIVIEFMTSDRKPEASREGSKRRGPGSKPRQLANSHLKQTPAFGPEFSRRSQVLVTFSTTHNI